MSLHGVRSSTPCGVRTRGNLLWLFPHNDSSFNDGKKIILRPHGVMREVERKLQRPFVGHFLTQGRWHADKTDGFLPWDRRKEILTDWVRHCRRIQGVNLLVRYIGPLPPILIVAESRPTVGKTAHKMGVVD